jgi:hypothetical protein
VKLNLARTLGLATATALAAAMVGATSATANAATSTPDHATVVGHVYEATNAAGDNAVQVFDRYADGQLAASGTVATGGQGTAHRSIPRAGWSATATCSSSSTSATTPSPRSPSPATA